METGKTSIERRIDDNPNGDIADWLNTVAKQQNTRTGAFRRTLSGLLGG